MELINTHMKFHRDMNHLIFDSINSRIIKRSEMVFGSVSVFSGRFPEVYIIRDEVNRSIHTGNDFMGWDY